MQPNMSNEGNYLVCQSIAFDFSQISGKNHPAKHRKANRSSLCQCLATLANGTPLQVKALDQRCHPPPPESEIRKTSRNNLSACIPQRRPALWLILGVGIRAICKQGTCQLDFIRFLLKTAKTPTLQNLQKPLQQCFCNTKSIAINKNS